MNPNPHDIAAAAEDANAQRTEPTGTMAEAVTAHVLDHIVRGPVEHRPLMDAAQTADATITALRARCERLEMVCADAAAFRHYVVHNAVGRGGDQIAFADCTTGTCIAARAALAEGGA